jgi:hypothetical protein
MTTPLYLFMPDSPGEVLPRDLDADLERVLGGTLHARDPSRRSGGALRAPRRRGRAGGAKGRVCQARPELLDAGPSHVNWTDLALFSRRLLAEPSSVRGEQTTGSDRTRMAEGTSRNSTPPRARFPALGVGAGGFARPRCAFDRGVQRRCGVVHARPRPGRGRRPRGRCTAGAGEGGRNGFSSSWASAVNELDATAGARRLAPASQAPSASGSFKQAAGQTSRPRWRPMFAALRCRPAPGRCPFGSA